MEFFTAVLSQGFPLLRLSLGGTLAAGRQTHDTYRSHGGTRRPVGGTQVPGRRRNRVKSPQIQKRILGLPNGLLRRFRYTAAADIFLESTDSPQSSQNNTPSEGTPLQKEAPTAFPATSGQCSVCLCRYREGDVLGELTCLHCFHFSCINQWLEESNTCPVCRESLKAIRQ